MSVISESNPISKESEFKSNEIKYSKQSLDRYGDDLTQLLLSFLSISDKIKFECVSKQWKRLIFNEQFKLIICNKFYEDIHKESDNNYIITHLANKKRSKNTIKIELSLLEIVLKKFKFIKEIEFSSRREIEITGEVIQLITNNCNGLKKLVINDSHFNKINGKQIRKFGEKFGKSLNDIEIRFTDLKRIEKLFDFLPNLKTIHLNNISYITSKQNKFYSKLEEIVSFHISSEGMKLLADNYGKSVNKIETQFGNIFAVLGNNMEFNEHLLQLSRFENLQTLKLSICTKSLIDNPFEIIANKCNKLKNLKLRLTPLPDYDIHLINGQIFAILGKFLSLKRLEIDIQFFELLNEEKFLNYVKTHFGNIEALKNCKDLKLLSISAPNLTDEHFKDINLHLPQLKSLIIKSTYRITDQTIHYLSKMQNLSRVEFKENDCLINMERIVSLDNKEESYITDESVSDLLNGCPHIKTVKFEWETKLTQTSIDAFIEIAKRNPKTKYEFYFLSISEKKSGINHKYKDIDNFLIDGHKFYWEMSYKS